MDCVWSCPIYHSRKLLIVYSPHDWRRSNAHQRVSTCHCKATHLACCWQTDSPTINDHPTISDNSIALADVYRSVHHTTGQHQAIIPQKARPYPHASNCSSTTGRLCPLINRPPTYTINATTQLQWTRTHRISSPKFGWCFFLSPCSTCQWIHHMPTCYTSVPPGSRDLHTSVARASFCHQPAKSTSAISPCERCCLRKDAAGIGVCLTECAKPFLFSRKYLSYSFQMDKRIIIVVSCMHAHSIPASSFVFRSILLHRTRPLGVKDFEMHCGVSVSGAGAQFIARLKRPGYQISVSERCATAVSDRKSIKMAEKFVKKCFCYKN